MYLSHCSCINKFLLPPTASCPVNRNVNDEECLPLVSVSKGMSICFWKFKMTFTLTKYLEKGPCHRMTFALTQYLEKGPCHRMTFTLTQYVEKGPCHRMTFALTQNLEKGPCHKMTFTLQNT